MSAPLSAYRRLPPGPAAVVELGVLFLPGIPAALWLWPNVQGRLGSAEGIPGLPMEY